MATHSARLPADLEFKIQQVAQQLRQREAVRCWIRLGIATLALTALFTLLLRFAGPLGFTRNSALIGFAACELAAFLALLYRPMRREIPLRRVAMFIDERHPELQNRILTAVEFSSTESEAPGASLVMIERCLEDSRAFARRLSFADLVDTGTVVRLFMTAAFFFVLSLAVMLARRDLWLPAPGVAAPLASPAKPETLDFTVEPGDARIRSGESQVIVVHSAKPGRKALIQWKTKDGDWRDETMLSGSSSDVHHHRFENVLQDLEYQVRIGRNQSKTFTIQTWIPPEVAAIDLTYTYPEYLGWPPREVPNGGNITAVEGSKVKLEINANKALKTAQLAFKSGKVVPLASDLEARWVGEIEVNEDDKYEVQLVDLDGNASEYNREYKVTAQLDKPPEIKIDFPRGDQEANAIEEVPFQFKVTDDFGVEGYGLRYEVAGGKSGDIDMKGEGDAVLEAAGEHMITLEEFGLAAGDLITWTVYAKDKKPDRDDEEGVGDLYFLEIRPFQREFEEAVSQGQGPQGPESQDAADQKEVVVALHNVRRRVKKTTEEKFKEDKAAILDAQLQLMQKFQQALKPMAEDQEYVEAVIKSMAAAVDAIQQLALPDPGPMIAKAMASGTEAYRNILKLEKKRVQVQQSQSMGAGAPQKQRHDIGALEINRNRNFYEEEKSTQPQQEAVEKALSRIKELAQRQKIVNKEIAKLISEMKLAKTEQEKKEIERRLEKLREEEKKNLERLDELQQELAKGGMDSRQSQQSRMQLEDVREQMNRSLNNMQEDRLQQARLSGGRALDSLNEMEEQLQDLSRQAAAERMKGLQEKMAELRKQEDEIVKQLDEMTGGKDSPSLRPMGENEAAKDGLMQRKSELTEEFKKIMEEASDLAEKSAQSQELMARKLGDWMRETSRQGILEDMEESEPLVRYGVWDSAAKQEKQIQEKLAQAQEGLDDAARAMVTDDLEGMQKALDELKDILDRQAGQESEVASADGKPNGKPGEEGTGSKEASAAGDKGKPGGKQGEPKEGEDGNEGAQGPGSKDQKDGKRAPGQGGEPTEEQQERARALAKEGKELAGQGKISDAAEKFEKALAEDPNNPEANAEQGKIDAMRGDLQSAIERYERAVAGDPGDAESAKALARAKERLDKLKSEAEIASAIGDPAAQDGEKGGEEKGKGDQAGKEPGDSEGQGQGEKPGTKPGEGSGKEPGDQPGDQPGADGKGQGDKGQAKGEGQSEGDSEGQSGKPGAEPGKSQGSQPGQRPGQQQGGGGSDSPQSTDGQPSPGDGGAQRPGASRGGDPNGRGGWIGADSWDRVPPEFARDFIAKDYQGWVERLRDAESLLPKDSPYRQEAERVRSRIEQMRREYTRHSLAPKFDLLLNDVVKPLVETAERLELEIMKQLKAKEFVLTDDGEVPSQYRKRVAEYFEALSETEGRP